MLGGSGVYLPRAAGQSPTKNAGASSGMYMQAASFVVRMHSWPLGGRATLVSSIREPAPHGCPGVDRGLHTQLPRKSAAFIASAAGGGIHRQGCCRLVLFVSSVGVVRSSTLDGIQVLIDNAVDVMSCLGTYPIPAYLHSLLKYNLPNVLKKTCPSEFQL